MDGSYQTAFQQSQLKMPKSSWTGKIKLMKRILYGSEIFNTKIMCGN